MFEPQFLRWSTQVGVSSPYPLGAGWSLDGIAEDRKIEADLDGDRDSERSPVRHRSTLTCQLTRELHKSHSPGIEAREGQARRVWSFVLNGMCRQATGT